MKTVYYKNGNVIVAILIYVTSWLMSPQMENQLLKDGSFKPWRVPVHARFWYLKIIQIKFRFRNILKGAIRAVLRGGFLKLSLVAE